MVYVFFAPGFEEIEAIAPVDILRRAGLEVTTVGVGAKEITGAHGIAVLCDKEETQVTPEDMELLVLPGGMPGTRNLENSPVVQHFVDSAVAKGCYIGAICAAPSILGHKGLLQGRKATSFPEFASHLTGADYTGASMQQDEKIITARGAGVAVDFGLALVQVLTSAEKASQLAAAMQCP